MHTSIGFGALSLALLLVPSTAQSTVSGISQLSDGQVQAPTSSILSPSTTETLADPVATTTTSESYENPFTIYTTQTNSLGVITGQPSVVTSQPDVVTSQPPSATLPSVSGYWYGNSSSIATETSAESNVLPSTLATSTVTGSGSSSVTGSRSATATFAQATGAAASGKIVGSGLGFVILALGFSML